MRSPAILRRTLTFPIDDARVIIRLGHEDYIFDFEVMRPFITEIVDVCYGAPRLQPEVGQADLSCVFPVRLRTWCLKTPSGDLELVKVIIVPRE
jgi:hypothetical protein